MRKWPAPLFLAGDKVILLPLLGYLRWGVRVTLCPRNHTDLTPEQGRAGEERVGGSVKPRLLFRLYYFASGPVKGCACPCLCTHARSFFTACPLPVG